MLTGLDPNRAIASYSFLCYLALTAVFLTQLHQGLVLLNVAALILGLLGVVLRRSFAPIAYLLLIAANHVVERDLFTPGLVRTFYQPRWLDLGDLLLCLGTLAYVAGHYRLQGIWYHVLAADPRRKVEPAPQSFKLWRPTPFSDAQRRKEENVPPQEISLFLISLPVWALIGEVLAMSLAPNYRFFELPAWLTRILIVVWALALGVFLVWNLLSIWKCRGMGQRAAALFLQDTLWRETRGEQRKVERWLAWQKVRYDHLGLIPHAGIIRTTACTGIRK